MSEQAELVLEENVVNSQDMEVKFATNLDGYHEPGEFYCTKCDDANVSVINYSYGKGTYLWCCLLCFLTLVGGLIPFCCKKCQNKTHYCPVCANRVGYTEYKIF